MIAKTSHYHTILDKQPNQSDHYKQVYSVSYEIIPESKM